MHANRMEMETLYRAFLDERGGPAPAAVPQREFARWVLRRLYSPPLVPDEQLPGLRRGYVFAYAEGQAMRQEHRPAHIPNIHWDDDAPYDYHIVPSGNLMGIAWPVSLAALSDANNYGADRRFGLRADLPEQLANFRLVVD